MLNIFKKKEENLVKTIVEETYKELEPIITSKDIQQDLHKSFEEVLAEFDLKESKETQIENYKNQLESFKEENKEIYAKIEILKNLNLSGTPSATKSLESLKHKEDKVNGKISKIQAEIDKVQELKDLTAEYALKYPFYKFVDEETMIKIMHKYDLVLGEAFMYSREIPDENLEIINYFSEEIKESESIEQLLEIYTGGWSTYYTFRNKPEPITIDYKTGINIPDFYYTDRSQRVVGEYTISKFKMIAPESHFTIPSFRTRDYKGDVTNVPIAKINETTRKFQFNTSKLNEVEQKKREVLDPIAALEVKGGYIIMSAWDSEAEIPEIQTNMLN